MTKEETIKFIKQLYPQLPETDLEKFLHVIKSTGLDPVRNQIYLVGRNSKNEKGKWEKSYTIQTSIDGFRLIAERTEMYSPGKEPKWNYNEDGELESSTAYVKKMTKDGTWHEVGATAYLEEYVQKKKDNTPTPFWKKMPKLMLSKCAESLALRKAFPEAFSSVYTDEEMNQANDSEQNSNQNDSQNDYQDEKMEAKKDIRTESEIDDLIKIFDYIPEYRETIEEFLQKQNIFHFKDMPKVTYTKVLANAKKKANEKLKKEVGEKDAFYTEAYFGEEENI